MNRIELTEKVFSAFSCNQTEKVDFKYFPFQEFEITFPIDCQSMDKQELIEGICRLLGKPLFMLTPKERQEMEEIAKNNFNNEIIGIIKVEIKDNFMYVKHSDTNTNLIEFKTDGENLYYEEEKAFKKVDISYIQRMIVTCLNTIYSTVSYITSPIEQRPQATTERERIRKSYEQQQAQQGNKSKKYIYRTVYKIDDINKSSKKISYTKHTDVWEVRGHWRTLKTGKKTWVKPYKKGTGEAQPKEYKITQVNKNNE